MYLQEIIMFSSSNLNLGIKTWFQLWWAICIDTSSTGTHGSTLIYPQMLKLGHNWTFSTTWLVAVEVLLYVHVGSEAAQILYPSSVLFAPDVEVIEMIDRPITPLMVANPYPTPQVCEGLLSILANRFPLDVKYYSLIKLVSDLVQTILDEKGNISDIHSGKLVYLVHNVFGLIEMIFMF
ncbi:hypothetical protein L218DRAFT_950853 [Marasmius fiardii PR-910]|nr:hypothetical protein L218DRAFT_950853 [Marasmius fiardii PR-910]